MARSVDGATPRSRRLEWISVLQRLQDGSVSRPDRLRRKRTCDSQNRRRHHFQRECWSKQVSMKRSEVDYGAQSKRARNKDAETPPCPDEGLGLDATRVRQAQVFLVPRINKGMLRRFVNRKELDAELPSAPQFPEQ